MAVNKVYSLVWNRVTGAWVVVSELTKSRGKSNRGARQAALRRAGGIAAPLILAAAMGGTVWAGTAIQGMIINPITTGGISPAAVDANSIAI
ncbi:MAG TPA: hypothetical protein DDZ58_05025, partial [Achromobacter sp.]|nr:hypothetical protein [Achromobacter sp.]